MSPRKEQTHRLLLTDSALRAVTEIEQYSQETWGKTVAARYLDDLEAALERLRQNPELLRHEPRFHDHFGFYRVNKHLLVCDIQRKAVFVLAIIHATRDIPERLADLEPTLKSEIAMLHEKIKRLE